MNQSTNTPWIIFGIIALVVLVAVGAVSRSGNAAEAVEITIASSSTKKEWLNDSVSLFNKASRSEERLQIDGKAVRVVVLEEEIEPGKFDHYRSGTMVTDILSGKIQPVVASPAEESWLEKLGRDWGDTHNSTLITANSAALVRTPLVIAMWQSRATALGCWPVSTPDCTWKRLSELAINPEGWGSVGHEEWGNLKFGYGYVGESNSGTLTAVMLCMTGAGKIAGLEPSDVNETNGCGKTIRDVEQAKVHSGRKSSWLLNWMLTGGPEYLDAVTTYEQEVI
jgi:Ca-activated chloride channel family protein